jgi:hypothetical protein
MNLQIQMATNNVQMGCVKNQVPRTRVDVHVMCLAKRLVTTRVFKLALVTLDFGLGHVNVVIHAIARTP